MELRDRAVHLEHRGNGYLVEPAHEGAGGSGPWALRADVGREVGTIVLLTPEGEDREPVYGGCLPGATMPLHEGSDWETIARALVNEMLER